MLEPVARAIAEKIQAADAISANSVLAAASLVAQAHADVEVPASAGSADRAVSGDDCRERRAQDLG